MKKLKILVKNKMDIGDKVKAKNRGEDINYVGLNFDRVMEKGDKGFISYIKKTKALGFFAEIKLEDGLYTVRQSQKEDFSDRLILIND